MSILYSIIYIYIRRSCVCFQVKNKKIRQNKTIDHWDLGIAGASMRQKDQKKPHNALCYAYT